MQPALPTACLDENVVLAFVAGRLSAASRGALEQHLGTCGSCMALVALAARATVDGAAGADGPRTPPPQPTWTRGSSIGRYTILDLVGHGGMGEVYAAYDPELDRRVAVKLLREEGRSPDGQGEARARLLREAKAIARLSHPNVIVVHDAGTVDGRVFIAMEFVRGQTLSEWLAAGPRSWPELREVFLAAGRGLGAAHAAGLVHRDVKPQNIMVGDDGAVRVTDFGLASDVLGPGDEPPAATGEPLDEAARPVSLTRSGVWLGTPLYMAPEQFRAQKAGARSDQFSFCVALYEAVYGERPFAGDSLKALRDAVVAGRLREPTRRSAAPQWVRKLILRGLSTDPADRFPSMDALLVQLGRDPTRRRRALALGVAVGAVLLAAGAIAQRSFSRPAGVLCSATQHKVAPIWELPEGSGPRPRRTAAQAAFLATGKSYAAVTWEKASAIVDAYVRRWTVMAQENCEATHVTGEQSPQVLDLRSDCLNSALGAVQAITDLFAHADAEVVTGAVTVAGGLPDIARCADTRLLRAIVKPPADPGQRARALALTRQAATLRALTDAGKPNEVLPAARTLVNDALALGYEPVIAEALSVLGVARSITADYVSAVESLQRALPAAVAARDDPKAAEIAAVLASDMVNLARPQDAAAWTDMGDAFAARAGASADRARGWLAQARGNAALEHDRYGDAARWYRQAISFKEKASGEGSVDVGMSYNTLAIALNGQGDRSGALDANDRGGAIVDRVAGPDSMMKSILLTNRGEILNDMGRPAEALQAFEQSLRVFTALLSHDTAAMAFPLTGMGRALLTLQRPKEATAPLERALKIREAENPTLQYLGETRFALGRALWEGEGARARAVALVAQARADYVKQATAPATAAVREITAWQAAHPWPPRRP